MYRSLLFCEIMMYKEKFEKEFISRTIVLLKQYEKCRCINTEHRYENTLFLNLCLGLLIIPKQAYDAEFKLLRKEKITKEFWGIKADLGEYNVYDVIRHMRNGIAHSRCEFLSKDNKTITHISIKDVDRDESETFNVTLTIQEFTKFVLSVYNYIINL